MWGGQAKNKTKPKLAWDIANLPNIKGGIKFFHPQTHAWASVSKIHFLNISFERRTLEGLDQIQDQLHQVTPLWKLAT